MGKRGPPKKPTATKKQQGTYRPDRDATPDLPVGLPECPDFLSDDAKDLWPRLGRQLVERGLLTPQDQLAFALLCQAWADWKQAVQEVATWGLTAVSDSGSVYQHPVVGIRNRAWLNVLRGCQQFGLTASSRTGMGSGSEGKGELTAEEKAILGITE